MSFWNTIPYSCILSTWIQRLFPQMHDRLTLPYLLLRADVDIEITSPLQNFKCYALDTTGKRLGEIEIVRNCETAKLSLSTHSKYGQTIAFELVEQK